MTKVSRSDSIMVLVTALIWCIIAIFSLAPIPQDRAYHHFADTREFLGIPNFGDVMGNLAFFVVGVAGILTVWKRKDTFDDAAERWLWMVFFLGIVLVAFGSGYYHLYPTNATLVWDRLPMTVAFMSLFSLIIMERIHRKAGLYVLPLLVLCGVGSVWYWDYTEKIGRGDLRPYVLVQFFPMIAILWILYGFRARYSGTLYLLMTLVWYMGAKVLEHYDSEIFDMTDSLVSGHSLNISPLFLASGISCGM